MTPFPGAPSTMSSQVQPDTLTSPAPARGIARAHEGATRYFLGPLLPLLEDDTVSEIMVNGPADVFVERGGRVERAEAGFDSDEALMSAARSIAQFVGKTIDQQHPILDGRLPDGSRVCIVLDPVAYPGTSINIRRFAGKAVSPEFLIDHGSITAEAMAFLQTVVRAHLNVVVSGGTGSGKTTLLNILSNTFEPHERVVVIEDTRELQIRKEHVVYLEARPADAYGRGEVTVRDLFVASLRMRPDRIVVGEVRRGEALDLVQAMTSGHRGTLTTLHANTPDDACMRLETMALMADVGLPLAALRRQVASAIDVVVQISRMPDGRRLATHISEVALDAAGRAYALTDLFNLAGGRELAWTGARPRVAAEIERLGLAGESDIVRRMLAGGPAEGVS